MLTRTWVTTVSAIVVGGAGERMFEWRSKLARLRLLLGCASVGMAIVAPAGLLAAQFPAKDPAAACSGGHLKQAARVGLLDFKAYRDEVSGNACLQVLRGGNVIFRRTNDNGGDYTIGQPADLDSKASAIANGTDITGRGNPDMIVSYWTGGAHCCLLHYVFELEPTFRLLATLDAEDDDMAHFEQLDDHRYYYVSADWTFSYWPSSFAGSPSAPIVLQFVDDASGGGYHLALDKMRQPKPSSSEWADEINTASQTLKDNSLELDSGSTIWYPVMNLIYTGHSDLAWKFLDESWPGNDKKKDEWIEDFCSILKVSKYWPDLKATVTNAPAACANAKPDESRRRNR